MGWQEPGPPARSAAMGWQEPGPPARSAAMGWQEPGPPARSAASGVPRPRSMRDGVRVGWQEPDSSAWGWGPRLSVKNCDRMMPFLICTDQLTGAIRNSTFEISFLFYLPQAFQSFSTNPVILRAARSNQRSER